MQNYINPYQQQCSYPQQGPNAVSINIFTPQAYGSSNNASCPINQNGGFYSLYGQNLNPNLPMYPQNYNAMIAQNPLYQTSYQNPYGQMPYNQQMHQGIMPNDNQNSSLNNQAGMTNSSNLIQKTTSEENITNKTETENNTEEKTKKVTPLTDEYVKSLENYMNNENPKVRLIGTKELLERFKEDENRKDNPSLMPLLNKALRDPSPSVRFLGLTMLQLGYALGNDETVTILKEIQSQNQDKIGEDSLLATEILLNMAAGQKVEVPMTQNEIEKAKKEESSAK